MKSISNHIYHLLGHPAKVQLKESVLDPIHSVPLLEAGGLSQVLFLFIKP